jgi:hypothetical protein
MSSQTIPETRQRAGIPRARTGASQTPPGARPAPEPEPTPGRLAGLCGWAALLGFLGMSVGVRGLIAIVVKAPHWYQPTLIALGLSGIALIVAAFLTVVHRHVPWLFLALSSGVLLASIVVTAGAT